MEKQLFFCAPAFYMKFTIYEKRIKNLLKKLKNNWKWYDKRFTEAEMRNRSVHIYTINYSTFPADISK